ncbi:MAG: Gfo/Idh/MocA family oxidoreductase [Acidimicrobiia bacterium]
MRALVVGPGAVGARAARQLAESDDVEAVLLAGGSPDRARAVAARIGADVTAVDEPLDAEVDVVVLAGPSGTHAGPARDHLARGRHVVSTSDDLVDVQALLDLDAEATVRERSVVVGTGFSPGLSCLLVRHAAERFETVDEVHVARVGTGGPACARHHHRALAGTALDWRDHGWLRRPAGSGRELCWFPDPVGGRDCYRAELPDALLLVPEFPGVSRVTARLAANRRDRLTARLPMLRRPHPEGLVGALRVELRGTAGAAREVVVLGALDRPAVAAGTLAALAASRAAAGELATGAGGLARVEDPVSWLAALAVVGIKAAVFEGAG